MSSTPWFWQRLRARLAGSLALPILLPLAGQAWAQGQLPAAATNVAPPAMVAQGSHLAPDFPSVTIVAPQGQPLSLAECLHIALEKQPTIAAQRASLAAAETGRAALENLRAPKFLAPDLPVRRQQAAIGVSIAAAAVEQAERETVYAVTRLYYTVVYAQQQKLVADDVVDHFKATRDTAENLLKGGAREVTADTVEKITVYQRLAQTKQVDAAQGVERAKAALREAMGLGPDCPLEIATKELPTPDAIVQKHDIVCLALARRAELVQARLLSDVTHLEVDAQAAKKLSRVAPTFGIGADLHAKPVPQGSSDGEYRPGAIGPEMPNNLAGTVKYRVERANDYYARSLNVVDKTEQLLALEATDAFFRWQEASSKVPLTREAAEKGAKLSEDTRNAFRAEQRVKPEDVLTNEVLASQARAQYNETRYQLILALANLERITAGGFCAGLGK